MGQVKAADLLIRKFEPTECTKGFQVTLLFSIGSESIPVYSISLVHLGVTAWQQCTACFNHNDDD